MLYGSLLKWWSADFVNAKIYQKENRRLINMIDLLNSIIKAVSGVLYQPWCVPLILLAGGIIMTVRSKFIQARLFTEAFKVIMEKVYSFSS